jgi:hypothetical protein
VPFPGQAVAIAEAEDAAVFEEATDDRFDPDVLRQAGHAADEAADAAYDKIYLDAGVAGI